MSERSKPTPGFESGDTLHGTYPAVSTKGEAVVGPLNQLKLDAWTVHWDYVYGTGRYD